MPLNSFSANQGTQTPILTDTTGGVNGTVIAVQKVDISGQGTAGTLWNGNVGIPSGTLNIVKLGTVVGQDANNAAQSANPLAFGGTDLGGSIHTARIDNSGYLQVNPVSLMSNQSLTDAQNNPNTSGVAAFNMVYNTTGGGTAWDRLRGDGTNGVYTQSKSVSTVVNSQRYGWHDDATESGLIRTKLTRGELIAYIFESGHFYWETAGTAVTSNTRNYGDQSIGFQPREAQASGINVTVGTAPSASYSGANLCLPFYGSALGLCFEANSSGGNFGVMIDGESYKVINNFVPFDGSTASGVTGLNIYRLIAEDLPDGEHLLRINFPAGYTAAKNWFIYFPIVERRTGVKDFQYPVTGKKTTVQLTTSFGALGLGQGTNTEYSGLVKIMYCNTDVVPRLISAQDNSSGFTFWQQVLAPQSFAVLDLSQFTAINQNDIKHKADAASVVSATYFGFH